MGMTKGEYVWIVTDGITSHTNSISPTLISSCKDVIAITSYAQHTGRTFQDFLVEFRTLFQSTYPNEPNLEPNL